MQSWYFSRSQKSFWGKFKTVCGVWTTRTLAFRKYAPRSKRHFSFSWLPLLIINPAKVLLARSTKEMKRWLTVGQILDFQVGLWGRVVWNIKIRIDQFCMSLVMKQLFQCTVDRHGPLKFSLKTQGLCCNFDKNCHLPWQKQAKVCIVILETKWFSKPPPQTAFS